MEKQLFEKYKGSALVEMLDSNADEVLDMEYTEFLTEAEIVENKNQLALRSIEELRLLDEKKLVNEKIKAILNLLLLARILFLKRLNTDQDLSMVAVTRW